MGTVPGSCDGEVVQISLTHVEGETGSLTELLHRWRRGDTGARDALLERVYPELQKQAQRRLRRERPDHTLQPTALVNEVYLRLSDSEIEWSDRVHFFAVASQAMRRVLVDHAKAKRSLKRGGGRLRVTLVDEHSKTPQAAPDVLDLDAALTRLAELDERKARIVELHYFGGLTYDEAAEALGVSEATITRELRFARAWLERALA